MYLPVSYEGTTKDYHNLLNGVQLWDVGVERQIQIKGPIVKIGMGYATAEIAFGAFIRIRNDGGQNFDFIGCYL